MAALRLSAALGMATIAGCGGGYGGGMGSGMGAGNNGAPMIATQPSSQMVSAGRPVTFSVMASGYMPLSYQWLRDGSAIGGATAASYTTPPTSAADSGSSFAVQVSNIYGLVTSSPAVLTVM